MHIFMFCPHACMFLCIRVHVLYVSSALKGKSAVCHADAGWNQGLLHSAHWSWANTCSLPQLVLLPLCPFSLSVFSLPSYNLFSLLCLNFFPFHLYSLSSCYFLLPLYTLKGVLLEYKVAVNMGRWGRGSFWVFFGSTHHSDRTPKGTCALKAANTWEELNTRRSR